QMKGDYLLPNNPALRTVADWLEADGHLTEAICDEEAWVHAVEPDWLAYHVVESLADDALPSERHRVVRDLLGRAIGGDHSLWGDEYPVRVRVSVCTSSDEELVLGCRFLTFAEYPPVTWDGLFRSASAYRGWLRSMG